MSHPLADACLKIKGAKANLDKIHDMFADWHSLNPYEIVRQPDISKAAFLYEVQVNTRPPDMLGIAISELAHNLRSALNLTIWQLSNTPDEGITEFPIFWEKTPGTTEAIRRRLTGIPAYSNARDIVRSLQPYHRGDDAKQDLLWVLYCLNTVDKYQTVHALGLLIRFVFHIGDQAMALSVSFRRLYDKTPVLIPKIPLPPGDNFQVQFATGIALADVGPTGFATTETFQGLYDYVGGIVLSFERFF